jgi:predicted transcriptional regulator
MASQADRVALYAAIRRESRAGVSAREIERKLRVSRRTVAKALAGDWPTPRKKLPSRSAQLNPYRSAIDEMLRADLDA